ncbi:L type [Durusdinium trenchii]|uniref:L type n=1 Tax=Durusdinium trenchii TaxID=1381693 RepID=A0ABP0P6Q4_9DINO
MAAISAGRRMSAQLQALPGQLGLTATVEGDDPSMPNVPDEPGAVVEEVLRDKRKQEEEERKKIEEYDIKVQMHDKGGKATEVYKALRTDPNQFKGIRLKLHRFISWWGFDTAIGFVIICNAVTIGWETQVKSSVPLGCSEDCVCEPQVTQSCETVPDWLPLLDNVFYGIYVVELLARVAVYGLFVFKSHWVKFDFFLVLTATADLFVKAVTDESVKILMLVRMLRLARLARAVRLMVQFKTLWQLVQGLFHSLGTLLWTFLLISILMYVLAVIGMELIRRDATLPLDSFGSLYAKRSNLNQDEMQSLPKKNVLCCGFETASVTAKVGDHLLSHGPKCSNGAWTELLVVVTEPFTVMVTGRLRQNGQLELRIPVVTSTRLESVWRAHNATRSGEL